MRDRLRAGPDPELALALAYVLTVSILLQGIPEELLWRGYFQTTAMSRLTPIWAAIYVSFLILAAGTFSASDT